MKICANCKYYEAGKLSQPLCTKLIKTEVDIITGKERLVGYTYAISFRQPDPYSKLYRTIAYLITKDNYWKEIPCGPEENIMKLCINCIHHRQSMNAQEHYCNLAAVTKICPVTGQELRIKISCFQARDLAGFCKPEGIHHATK